jgi:hypothetical protein
MAANADTAAINGDLVRARARIDITSATPNPTALRRYSRGVSVGVYGIENATDVPLPGPLAK